MVFFLEAIIVVDIRLAKLEVLLQMKGFLLYLFFPQENFTVVTQLIRTHFQARSVLYATSANNRVHLHIVVLVH